MYTPLDLRQPIVMLWLPCLWLIKMHEAQAECQSAPKFDPSSASNFGSDSLLMQFGECLAL
jgi:hypothetical protein